VLYNDHVIFNVGQAYALSCEIEGLKVPPPPKSPPVANPDCYHLPHKRDQVQVFSKIKSESLPAKDLLMFLNVPYNQLPRLTRRSTTHLSNENFIAVANGITKSVQTRARYLFLCLAFLDDMVFH
jgi:hypothetical protein